jgi:proton glutamate symport protein
MLLPLAKLALTCYAAQIAFALLVLLPSLLISRIPMRKFIAAVAEPAAIGFATTTSEAALPLAIERMLEFGVPWWILSFVIPAGYSFNLTGSAVYLSRPLSLLLRLEGCTSAWGGRLRCWPRSCLPAKGLQAFRAVLVVLMAMASAIHILFAPIMLILGIDALLDMGRTAINVIGNFAASAIVFSSERVLVDSSLAAL